jgi:hypothetical protein
MTVVPIRAIAPAHQSEIEAQPIVDLVQSAFKRAIMAAWEQGAITDLEAWWLIQREGLQHK